jgi:hypothetical protein
MYRVRVHWALGDFGTAVAVGARVDVNAVPTRERRARHHTDMARAWWSWGTVDEAATAVLDALACAPSEVTDRRHIREIAQQLVRDHRRLRSVQNLTARLANAV